jgi:hypothetical protein
MVRTKGVVRFLWMILLGVTVLSSSLLLGIGQGRHSARAAACWEAAITEQWTDLSLAGSVLRVSVEGRAGLPVKVRSEGGFEAIGFTGTKPEYGPYVAEFAPLSKATYLIEPAGVDAVFEVWLDGKNYTRVDFTPKLCASTPTFTPRPATPTATRQATKTPTPTGERQPPTATQTPPSALHWQGRVAEHLEKPSGHYWGTIAVRVIGRPAGQEVEIRSNGWSITGKTGTKPEQGSDACEFGALHTGTYRLTPTGLGTYLDVTLEQGDFVLVEFYQTGGGGESTGQVGDGVSTRWFGTVVENTSGDQSTDYVASAIAVVVAGKPWHEVEIRSNGWSTTTQTGTKPDYGSDACEFGGLRAATYTITPKDLGVSLQVTMDGWGWAMVRFEQVAVSAPEPTATTQATAKPSTQPTKTPTPSPTLDEKTGWQAWIISNTSGQSGGSGVSSIIVVRVLNYGGVPVHITAGGNWSDTCVAGAKPEFGPDACSFGGLRAGTYFLQPEGADIEIEIEMDGIGTAEVHFAPP